MERRAHLVDTAIAVLSRSGARGLTHRAVDTEAGLPSGSTSNVFRTRHALVTAVIDALLERSARRVQAAIEVSDGPGAALARFVDRTLTEAHHEVRARMSLLIDPDADALRSARVRLLDGLIERPLPGTPESRRLVVAAVDGLLFDAVLLDRLPDPLSVERAITALVAGLEPPAGTT